MKIIKGKNFVLRPPKKEEVDSLWENYNESEISKNMVTMDSEREFKDQFLMRIKIKDKTSDRFIVVVDKKVFGKITLRQIIPNLKATVSSWIGKDYRGKGIMTEAKKLACKYWFKKFNLRRIEARTRAYNKAAQKSLEKSGFKLEGILRKNILKNGKYYDDLLYSKIK